MTSHDSFSQYFHFFVQSQQLPRLIWILFLFCVTTYSTFAQSSAKELCKRMDSSFSGIASTDTPGFAVLVKKDGKIIFEKGYGVRDLRAKTAIDAQTNFRLASFTKQFTAMAVMLLVHDGKLRYDRPLTEIFSEFPGYGKTITVRNLLNHTGGLPDYEDLMDAAEKKKAQFGRWKNKFATPKFCNCWKKNRTENSLREQNGSIATPATWSSD